MNKTIKIVIHLIAALLIFVLLAALVTGCFIMYKSLGTKGQFTYLIVLGTTVNGTEPSPMLEDRIEAAANYMEANPDVIAVVTGGKADGVNISEAQCMYNGLVDRGIEKDRILMEEQATTTAENFEYSVALLEKTLGKCPTRLGVLSSEFHLLRAAMIGQSYDLKISTIPANTSHVNTFFKYFLREIPMVWYDGVKAAIR